MAAALERRWLRSLVRPTVRLLVDVGAWPIGIVVAVWSRYDFALTPAALPDALLIAVLAALVQVVVSQVWRVYHGRHGYGSFENVRAVTVTVLTGSAFALTVNLMVTPRLVPASSAVIGGLLALLVMLAARYLYRHLHDRSIRPGTGAEPVLLFGAGEAGRALTRTMLRDRASRYVPVGLLDDDPGRHDLKVHGVPILGGRRDIPAAVARTGARTLIFSVANAHADVIRDVQAIALTAGTTFKVVPSIGELLDGRAGVADVRDVRLSDLLGRRQIDTDVEPIAGYLTGKRVLVTGAGGSIGSELCRQLQRFGPSELMMLDRDESALHAVQLSIRGRALLDSSELILADLRDVDAIREIFTRRDPQVVFHAAALKHLSLLQRHPGEAVKTNIRGTQTVLEMSRRVERFVNISTDKAARPVSVLGYTKRITERLTAHAANHCDGTFLSVRFGNVLGSRGSVLTAFTAQADAGGPLTVTHPEVSRYFMLIQEAVQLVIQAAAIGRDGEVLVLDMGKPVRIYDLARQLVRQSSRRVEIVYTGLRPGEKLHEELFAPDEHDVRPFHPLISHVSAPPLHPSRLQVLDPSMPASRLIANLADTAEAGAEALARSTGSGPTVPA